MESTGSSQAKFKVGDWAWNLRESSLDLRPGWLIEVISIDDGPSPFRIKGRAVLHVGNYNDVGYYFGEQDLEPIL